MARSANQALNGCLVFKVREKNNLNDQPLFGILKECVEKKKESYNWSLLGNDEKMLNDFNKCLDEKKWSFAQLENGFGNNIMSQYFDFDTVKKNIQEALKDYKNRVQITLVPNITNICYGRGVGYKIEEIVLDEKTQQISATKIRAQMRKDGKLK